MKNLYPCCEDHSQTGCVCSVRTDFFGKLKIPLILLFVVLVAAVLPGRAQTNIALGATVQISGGGKTDYGPHHFNDGVIEPYNTSYYAWVHQNGWMEYSWPTEQTLGYIKIYFADRPLSTCTVQYWSATENRFIDLQNYVRPPGAQEDVISLAEIVTTTKLRLANISDGSISPNFREVEVYNTTIAFGTYAIPSGCGATDGNIKIKGLTPTKTYSYSYLKDGELQPFETFTADAGGWATMTNLGAGQYTKLYIRDAIATYTLTTSIVFPGATVNEVPNQTVCNAAFINAVSFTGTNATKYTWTNDNTSIGIAASGTGNISSVKARNLTNAPVTATITVTPWDGTCAGKPKSFTITVLPIPQVSQVTVPANGVYKAGNVLIFGVMYPDLVEVTLGELPPTLELQLNSGVVHASYASGSGTNTLLFQYVVAATDNDPDGIVMKTYLDLKNASFRNTMGCLMAGTLSTLPPTTGIKIINQASQTITFNTLPAKTYGDADFLAGATASSELAVTYTSSNPAVATILNGMVHITGAGTTTITANQPGNGDYLPAAEVQQTLTVKPRAIVVTVDEKTKVYGDADPALTYTFAPALVGNDHFSGGLQRVAGENVGTYAIDQGTLALNGNYSIVYNSKNLTITPKSITVTANERTKVYGQFDPVFTYTFAPALVASDHFSGKLQRVAGENVGAYAINLGTLALGNNYSITYVGKDFTISPKTVTVIADAKAKVYGDTDPEFTYTVSPALVGGDQFTGSLSRVAGENAGTYLVKQGTLALNNNYAITYGGSFLTITPKSITVTADVKTKVYGDADPALTYAVSPALVGGDAFTGSLTRAVGENTGVYAVNQGTLALNNNYSLTYAGSQLTITRKPVAISAVAKTKVYGDADPALTYTYAPELVSGDVFEGGLQREPGENAGNYAINQGTLALNNNYSLTYAGSQLTITRKPVAISAVAKTKVYGDADPALTYTYAPELVTGDAFEGSLQRVAGENAGTYAISQGTLALSNNYLLSYAPANLVINKAILTVTSADKTVCYGNQVYPTSVSYTGFKYNDNVASLSKAPVTKVPSFNAAGNYALTPAGGAAANYSFNYINGQLTVLPTPDGLIEQVQSGAGVVSGYQLTAPAGATYKWNTAETTNAITVRSTGNYSVIVTNQQGCSNRFDLTVKLQTISIPNTFSPNGDGINDYWVIPELANYPGAYVTIVNRGGQVVFESRNFTRWDGKSGGRDLPAGVYFYRVRKAPGAELATGWLNLLR